MAHPTRPRRLCSKLLASDACQNVQCSGVTYQGTYPSTNPQPVLALFTTALSIVAPGETQSDPKNTRELVVLSLVIGSSQGSCFARSHLYDGAHQLALAKLFGWSSWSCLQERVREYGLLEKLPLQCPP